MVKVEEEGKNKTEANGTRREKKEGTRERGLEGGRGEQESEDEREMATWK